jgi:hypothetical protein
MRISADFYLFWPVFYDSKCPLNINQYLILTDSARPKAHVSRGNSMHYVYSHIFKTSLLYCFKIERRRSGLSKPPGAPVWSVNMAQYQVRGEAANRIWYRAAKAVKRHGCAAVSSRKGFRLAWESYKDLLS